MRACQEDDLPSPARPRRRIDPDDNDEADVAGNAVVVAGLQVVRVVDLSPPAVEVGNRGQS